MKLVATCSASVTLSNQVHVKVCNLIPSISERSLGLTCAGNYEIP